MGGSWTKVAKTLFRATPAVTWQVVPKHPSPEKPTNFECAAASAERWIVSPSVKYTVHWPPQLSRPDSSETEPAPDPCLLTATGCWAVNWAVTASGPSMTTSQLPVWLVQAPDQPVKAEWPVGVGIRGTTEPSSYGPVQTPPSPQPLISPRLFGVLTEPVPVPARLTVSGCSLRVKVANTSLSSSTLTVHWSPAGLTLSQPVQGPINECGCGVAVRTIASGA